MEDHCLVDSFQGGVNSRHLSDLVPCGTTCVSTVIRLWKPIRFREPWTWRRYVLRHIGSSECYSVPSPRRHLHLTPLWKHPRREWTSNINFTAVAWLFAAAETCSLWCWLTTAVSSGSAIPDFIHDIKYPLVFPIISSLQSSYLLLGDHYRDKEVISVCVDVLLLVSH
jgi:hypothetical protein